TSRDSRATGTEWSPVRTASLAHPTGRYHAGRPGLLFHHVIGITWSSSATASISVRLAGTGSRGETTTARYRPRSSPLSSSRTPWVAPPTGSFSTYSTVVVTFQPSPGRPQASSASHPEAPLTTGQPHPGPAQRWRHGPARRPQRQ